MSGKLRNNRPTYLQKNNLYCIAIFTVTLPIVINVPTRGLLAVETKNSFLWLANLNIKRIVNITVNIATVLQRMPRRGKQLGPGILQLLQSIILL